MQSPNPKTAHGVSLADVLTTALPPASDALVTGCTTQSRFAKPGDAFFAVQGDTVLQAEAARQAINRGAVAVVTDAVLPSGGVQFVVADLVEAFGAVCHALMAGPSKSISSVAVAGSQGKSTTIRLLDSIYRQAGREAATADNGRLDDGLQLRCLPHKRLTAAPVAAWLARSVANGCTHALVGVNSRGAELAGAELAGLCLVGPRPQVREETLARVRSEGVVVAPVTAAKQLGDCGSRVFTYGDQSEADLWATVIERNNSGQTLILRSGDDAVAVDTPVVGEAFVQNCLAAAAVAVAGGIGLCEVARGLESAGRTIDMMRPVVCGQPFSVYLDAAPSPAAVSAAVHDVQRVTSGRVLTVVDLPQNASDSRQVLRAAGASGLLVAPRTNVSRGVSASVRWVDDRFSAVALALALAEAGDAVLVLGDAAIEIDANDPPPNDHVVSGLIRLRLKNELAAGVVA